MRPENILLVDDNELLRSLMSHLFSKDFEHVTAVGTGIEALEQIERSFYHFIILDNRLPDIEGLALLPYITQKSPHSKVIMITTDADDGIRQEALKRGAFEFVEKPFDIYKLKSALRSKRVFRSMKARIAEIYQGGTCNLSDSGMLMVTDAVLACGTTVDILLHTPDNRDIPLKGKVIRTADPDGIPRKLRENMKHALGIQLVGPPPEYYSLVDSLMV